MVEPSGHCPYLGLKQNQAIRFASPTPEHRCYAAGQAQEIPQIEPDYQVRYCLSASHVRCPLYMGMPLPTTSTPLAATAPAGASSAVLTPAPAQPVTGLRAWLADLAPRDRFIYTALLAVLLLIVIGYALGGLAFISGLLNPTAAPTATGPTAAPPATATMPPASPTETAPAMETPSPTGSPLPTSSPTSTPADLIPVTNTPTIPIVIPPPPPPPVFPTDTPTPLPELPPVELPTATPSLPPVEETVVLPTITPEAPTVTPEAATATPALPTDTPELPTATPEAPTATPEQPTATPAEALPTATP